MSLQCQLCRKLLSAKKTVEAQCNGCRNKFHLKCLKKHLLYSPKCPACNRFNFVHLSRKEFTAKDLAKNYSLRVFFASPFDCVRLNARLKLSAYMIDLARLQNRTGDTLLHEACFYDHIEVVKLLLDTGHEPYLANTALDFPIHVAARQDNVEIVKLFQRTFPDSLYLLNSRGELPLHVAVVAGNARLAVVLAGSMNPNKLDSLNEAGESALVLALAKKDETEKYLELVAYLIGAGCDAGLRLRV